MKKWLIVLVGVTALAGGLYLGLVGVGAPTLSEKVLTFAEVRRTTIRDVVSATGLVEPRETLIVSSEIPGAVIRVSARIGDVVYAGDDLLGLDDRQVKFKLDEAKNGVRLAKAAVAQARATLKQAKASKDAAKRNLDIQVELKNSGGLRHELELATAQLAAADAGVDAADSGVKAAEAKEEAAQIAQNEAQHLFDITRIRVPGPVKSKREFLILDRKVHEGQMVGPQVGPLFTLAGSLAVVELHTQVAEGDINRVREGLKALFKIKNYDDDDADFVGVVKRIRPLASNIKGAVYYDTVIEVENRRDPKTNDWQLRPGMTASIEIVRVEHSNVWMVPINALNFKLEEAYQSAAARAKLAEWKQRPDAKDWHALWTWDESARQATPVFVRIAAKSNEVALRDTEGNEILEWEPGREPTGPLRVIINTPPSRAPGFFDQPVNVKI